MTNALPRPQVRTCPSCGSAVNTGALTCSSCGGVIAIENVLSRLRREFGYQAERVGQSIRDPEILIWVLAVIPILILPPLLALFISLRSSRGPDAPAPRSNSNLFVVIVAICNIILSVMFWRWLSELSLSGLSIGLFLRSLGINVHSPASSAGQI